MKRSTRLLSPVVLIALVALACNALRIPSQPPPIIDTLAGPGTPASEPPLASGNSMGDPNAPVKLVEFADYQCPFCKRYWQETQAQVLAAYVATGKVEYTVRSAGNWVSGNISAGAVESQDSAMAAYCAMDQNKFWEMHDALFNAAQGEEVGSFSPSHLESIAQGVGLDMSSFDSCMKSQKYLSQVNQDLQDAKSAGVVGVPFFVITWTDGGQTKTDKIDGAQPFDDFKEKLDAAVKASGG